MGEMSRNLQVTPELAQAVTRLGHLRRQLKELETEETLLREEILSQVGDWPKEAFPLRVGAFEVRLAERKGRIDAALSYQLLADEHLLAEVPFEPAITDPAQVDRLRRLLVRLSMPEDTRDQLVQIYKAAIDWHPAISHDVLAKLYDEAQLTMDQYRQCFKDGKPIVTALTVR